MTRYRAGVIGLGRMGWLYDASLPYPPSVRDEDGTPTELPPLRDHPDLPPTEHPGKEGLPTSYAAALRLHPRTELVAGCDPSEERLAAFGKHYGVSALYTDYRELLTSGAAGPGSHRFARCHSPGCYGAGGRMWRQSRHNRKADDADLGRSRPDGRGMRASGGSAGVRGDQRLTTRPLCRRRKLLTDGTIGTILSMETSRAMAQHNAWVYLMDSPAEWVIGVTDDEEAVRRNGEFEGVGLIRFANGVPGFLRPGAPQVHITGERGELVFDWKQLSAVAGRGRPGGHNARGDAVSGAAGVGRVVNTVWR